VWSLGREAAKAVQEATVMKFRWAALIALWTLLSGPALYSPIAARSRPSTVVGQPDGAAARLPASPRP
jgi:hypothetical protein